MGLKRIRILLDSLEAKPRGSEELSISPDPGLRLVLRLA
jgi:hypothetical protein